jgi:hypothetical protein
MASTYSALKIELIGTGEQQGTWGSTTNVNLGTALEEAIVGRATANFTSDANLTLTLTNSNATQVARNLVLNVTSGVSLTVTRDLIVPAIEKPYIIQNNTTGAQSIRVIVAGTGVTVPNGKTAFIYNDGTDVKYAFDHVGGAWMWVGMPRLRRLLPLATLPLQVLGRLRCLWEPRHKGLALLRRVCSALMTTRISLKAMMVRLGRYLWCPGGWCDPD